MVCRSPALERDERRQKTDVDGATVPDRNAEYLLYQTLLGTWPMQSGSEAERDQYTQRIQQYMEKALKEAKLHTSWINPNEQYDQAVRDFIAAILDDSAENALLQDFRAFVSPIARAGLYNSLSQVLLKIASPGVPDFYQGCESWNFSLVDPDNRRPVDFERLKRELAALQQSGHGSMTDLIRELLRTPEDGRIKLYLTSCALGYRRAHHDLFAAGAYVPLEAVGSRKNHLVAFAREQNGLAVVAVAARFFLKLNIDRELFVWRDTWADTVLPVPKLALDGRVSRSADRSNRSNGAPRGKVVLPLAEIFSTGLPVALLEARRP